LERAGVGVNNGLKEVEDGVGGEPTDAVEERELAEVESQATNARALFWT
jgi:hypothetical protein